MKNSTSKFAAFSLLLFASLPLLSQQANWTKEDKEDALRGTRFVQYTLQGKFLTAPRNVAADAKPSIVVRCTPGSFERGHLHGKFMNGYVYVGTVVDSQERTTSTGLHVHFRLDDGKLQTAPWGVSTDYSSMFFGSIDFNTLLYGHFMPHKEGTNPPVKKVVLGVDEFLGGEVVMQFDMPDPAEVADACAALWHK